MKKGTGILQALTAAVFALILTGCKKEKPIEERFPIAFQESSVWTKADEGNYFQEGNSIGVYSYYLPGGDESQKKEFMANQEVSYINNSWTYSPVRYWPTNSEDRLSFYAYYPYEATNATAAGVVSFEIDGKTDVLWANMINGTNEHKLSHSEGKNGVTFGFQHLFMRLGFKFIRDTGFGDNRYVESLSISGQSAFPLKKNMRLDVVTGSVDLSGETEYLELADTDGDNVTRYKIYASYDAPVIGDVMYIDYAQDSGTNAKKLTLSINVQGVDYPAVVSLDNPAPGNSYLISLSFSNSEVKPSVKLTKWITLENDVDYEIQ